MDKLGVGIVGLGAWGKNYLNTLRDYEHCQLFVCDDDPLILSDFRDVPRASFSELLSNQSVKALIIATPDDTHFEFTTQALTAGKDVLVEKPMAKSVAEAEMILRLSRRTEKVVAVGHTALYSCGFERLRQQIHSQSVDRILKIEAVRTSKGRRNGGDILWDLAPHDLAMAISLLGDPISVAISINEPDRCLYQLSFEKGIPFSGKVCWDEPPFYRSFKVFTTSGIYTCEEPIGITAPRAELPLNRLCRDFIRCCETRATPLSDVRLGLKVVGCLAALSKQLACTNTNTKNTSDGR
ncbi:MAG: Gfo/Idh/MocA family protein [bacterium]